MSPARARPAPDECFLPRSSEQQQQQQRCIAGLAPGCAPLVGEGCPGDSWFDELAQRFPIKSPVMINVGANKGYAVADFVARHDQSRGVSARAWHRAILNASAIMQSGNLDHLSCGVCKACKRKPPGRRCGAAADAASNATRGGGEHSAQQWRCNCMRSS